jgi:hypothetical protein
VGEIARRSLKAARPVGDPGAPALQTMNTVDAEERRATVAKLGDLMALAREGDENAALELRKVLDGSPDLAWSIIEGPGKVAESALIDRITQKDNLATKETLKHQLESMRIEVAGENPSPLERLLAERVVITWLQVQLFDAIYAFEMKDGNVRRGDYLQKCIDRAHRRHLSAVKALAQIRRMGPTVQINIAEKQINTSG